MENPETSPDQYILTGKSYWYLGGLDTRNGLLVTKVVANSRKLAHSHRLLGFSAALHLNLHRATNPSQSFLSHPYVMAEIFRQLAYRKACELQYIGD